MPSRRKTHLHGPEALSSVLRLVHLGRATTRAGLTESLRLTRARVGVIVGLLESLGLLQVDPHGPAESSSPMGRPSHGLSPNPSGPVVVVAQLHADGFSVGLSEVGGRLFSLSDHPLPRRKDPGRVLGLIARVSAERSKVAGRKCIGIGLALPLPVKIPDGLVIYPDQLGWPERVPARQIFIDNLARAGVDVPVAAANDARLEALAEYRRGAGAGARHMLYVTAARRGIGGALIVDGHLYDGFEGLAMEIGHIPVRPGGRSCSCGERGCFGVETDPAALLAAAGRKTPTVGPDDVQALRILASRSAKRAATELRERLGTGLATLADLLAPDRIVLGGLHAALYLDDPEHLSGVLGSHGWMARHRRIPVFTGIIPRPALSGAAELALESLLDNPLILSTSTHTRSAAR